MITQQRTSKNVTIMPADPALVQRDIRKKRLRVAPYCRVSTDSDEQLNSYEAQIEYYTAKIADTPEWTMVRMYADEGITGTSMKKRKEFLRLIDDCKKGRVNLVITKSVTRFARNTLEGLQTVRQLKILGIGVYFEKENVNTLYMDNEMILTFFFSQAQAESESLSGNVKWGHRKNFQDGKSEEAILSEASPTAQNRGAALPPSSGFTRRFSARHCNRAGDEADNDGAGGTR